MTLSGRSSRASERLFEARPVRGLTDRPGRSGLARRSAARPPLRDPARGQTATCALASAKFPALPVRLAWPPPAAAVQALGEARRIVVVGHTPPDGDCVGAALGLARGMTALGRQACAVVDAELPAGLAALGRDGDLHRTPTIAQPDLVVLVDVAQADRIGAARRWLQEAPAVLVVDHHRVRPTREQLGLRRDVPLTVWVDDRCDAASLQVAALLEALGAAAEGWTDRWSRVARPLAAGIATDTQWFNSRRFRARSLAAFKALLDGDLNALEALEAQIGARLPDPAAALLERHTHRVTFGTGGARVAELAVSRWARRAAVVAARREDPRMTLEDVSGHLMDLLDRAAGNHLAVLLQEETGGEVRVSVRSRCDALAVQVAEQLGGGGKRGVAGATVYGTLTEVRQHIRRILTDCYGVPAA